MLAVGVVVLVATGGHLVGWLVLAALELAYLRWVGMEPRFRNYLRAMKHVAVVPAAAVPQFQQMMAFLHPTDAHRFNELRRRCSELLKLRQRMRHDAGAPDDFQVDSLDRMLWLFLRLLHQRAGLEKFMSITRREELEADLAEAHRQLAASSARDAVADQPDSRLTSSIRERIATLGERIDSHKAATDGLELVAAEIDKTEQQLTQLCEVGMGAPDIAALSVQIDGISASLQLSEKIFSETPFGSVYDAEPAPPLLTRGAVTH